MLLGYARTSTLEQVSGLEAQNEALVGVGCEKIWQEQVSSIQARDALRAVIEYAREGDTLVVTKLDRLARSVKHLGEIIDQLEGKSVDLRILALGLDTSNATGKLMLNVLGSVAQFEREMMLERQREGILRVKRAGKFKGRQPISAEKQAQILRLHSAGKAKAAIASAVGVSERSVYRYIKAVKIVTG